MSGCRGLASLVIKAKSEHVFAVLVNFGGKALQKATELIQFVLKEAAPFLG